MAGTLKLGSIPPLTIWQGEELTFKVTSRLGPGSTFSKRAVPRPVGEMSLDEATGLFKYKPATDDREETTVWLRARKGAQEEKQKVVITPHPRLPPEYNVIRHFAADAPDPSDTAYVTIAEQSAGPAALFNNITDDETKTVETKEVFVSGIRVVLERNNSAYPLFERLHQRADLRRVTICADEVVVRSPLELYGADLNVYANRLVFEDAGGVRASISTTPVSYPPEARASKSEEGLKGQKAGDVRLYVFDIDAPGAATRIYANGGDGQGARLGMPGKPGDSINRWDGKCLTQTWWAGDETLDWSPDFHNLNSYVPVYAQIFEYYLGKERYAHERGTQGWPTSGRPPEVYPGRPGQGGDGGDIHAAKVRQIEGRIEQKPGSSGRMAEEIKGAPAGTPVKSCHARAEYTKYGIPSTDKMVEGDGIANRKRGLKILETDGKQWKHETKDGPVGPALLPDPKHAGKPGKLYYILEGGRSFWLHEAAVRAIIPFAHDAMLAGHESAVRDLVVRYRDAVEVKGQTHPDEPVWSALHLELSALVERIDSPYDYFGNPAGWVPMLSFEANMSLYEQEVDDAIRTFFLAYWIEKNQKGHKKAAATIGEAMERLRAETQRALTASDAASAKLSHIKTLHDTIVKDLNTLKGALESTEKALRDQVKADLWREHMLRGAAKVVGGVMQLVPVGQPVLGAFGKATVALSDIDLEKPFSVAPDVLGAFSGVAQEKLVPKVSKLFEGFKSAKDEEKKDAEKEKFDKAVATAKFKAKVKEHLDEQKQVKKEVLAAFSGFAVKDDEIKERLAKVVADCPEYKERVKELEALNLKKAAYAADLLAVLQTIDEAATTIMTNQFALIELRTQRDSALGQLSHAALQHARGMGERARRRLQKYQYYMLKSYHFMTFRDMPGVGFRSQRLFDEFVKIRDASADGKLTEKQFKDLRVVFEDQLKDAVEEIISWYQTHAPERVSPFLLTLTPEQLETLNGPAGLLDLDLMRLGALDLTQENVRITGIEAREVEIASPPAKRAVTVNLEFHHDGTSLLRRDGRLYFFRTGDYAVASGGAGGGASDTYRNDNMYWKSVVEHDAGKQTITVTQPAADKKSLVRRLINRNRPDRVSEDILDHQPAAWSIINVRRSGYSGKLSKLVLRVSYASSPVSRQLTTVLVRMPPGDEAQPVIQCDATDANGRRDGQGTFLRTFDTGALSKVTLRAPALYGQRAFLGWRLVEDKEDEGGETPRTAGRTADAAQLTPSPSLTLDLKERRAYKVEPVYAPVTYVPLDERDEPWPACPAGWEFGDWLFVNNSRATIRISNIAADPSWSGSTAPAVNEPEGNNIIKLSFDRVTLLPREAARLSVCINPEVPGPAAPMIRFEWEGVGDTYLVYFDGKGHVRARRKDGDQAGADKEIDLDVENRTLTFRP